MLYLDEIKDLIKVIDDVYMDICKVNYESVNLKLSKLLPVVSKAMTELVEVVIKLKAYGVDIPVEVLTAQMSNLLDGYERKDYICLSDTLHYEITDSLHLYIEIIEEMKRKNIVLE